MRRSRSSALLACVAVVALVALAGIEAWATPPTVANVSDERARHDYALNCSGCHRPDGSGVDGAVPSFASMGALVASEPGREYVIRVPGVAHAPVDDARLAALLNYVIVELAGVADARPFSATEVRRHRGAPLLDPVAARAGLRVE